MPDSITRPARVLQSQSDWLAELDALIATVLPGSTALSMFRFDFLTVWAVIVVVEHVPMFG